jgi:hypothetical protein
MVATTIRRLGVMDFIDGGSTAVTLNGKAMAIAAAVVCGVGLFLLTLLAAARGAGEHLGHLALLYPGFQVSYLGSLLGLLYGLITGAILGGAIAWIYNKVAAAP